MNHEDLKVVIVDYGLGNLFGISMACRHANMNPEISSDKNLMATADAILLPGVGAFGDAIEAMKSRDLVSFVRDMAQSGKILIGICLGMQLLMSESSEFGRHEGLNILRGRVRRFQEDGSGQKRWKVPQVGWNSIRPGLQKDWDQTPLAGLREGTPMYFTHSFYAEPEEQSDGLCFSDYAGQTFCAGLQKDNIFAFQFHPERSGPSGLQIYRNLARLIRGQRNPL